ncbi:MAG: diaminopimelate epimerase [Acidobacteriota bacterium]
MNVAGIRFTKMSAGGNDFIVIDNVTAAECDPAAIDAGSIARLCARAHSVGADGLIIIEASQQAHVKMNYFNADGGRAALCGNGVRCVARMVAVRRWAPPEQMTIETDIGTLQATVADDAPSFRLPLGHPRIERKTIWLEGSLDEISREFDATFVQAGVPHLVVEVRDAHGMDKQVFLARASRLRRHPDLGPDGANVDFVTTRDRSTLEIRFFERGIEGETMSSGSGCIASVLAAMESGRLDSPVHCKTLSGGTSTVTVERDDNGAMEVILAGEARIIYTGILHGEAATGFSA